MHTYLLKTLETLSCSKIPPIFTYICTFGFGIRPRARYFSGQIFGFGLKWKAYFRSFTEVLDFFPGAMSLLKQRSLFCLVKVP